jgi:DNA-binding NarL/FixJ family response regulator
MTDSFASVDPSPALSVAVVARAELLADAIAALLREGGTSAASVNGESLASIGPVDVVVYADADSDPGAALAELRDAQPRARIVVVVPTADATTLDRAVRAGAAGVLDTRAGGRELAFVVRRVADGRRVLPMAVAPRDDRPGRMLSHRQTEVLRLIAEGRSNHEIADELMITINTVKFHVRSIFRELGIHNRVEAAHAWARLNAQAHLLG